MRSEPVVEPVVEPAVEPVVEPVVPEPGSPPAPPPLAVRDLRIAFGGGVDRVEAVRGVSFDVAAGEVLALVGESGAGKSLTARALLGMAPRGAHVDGAVLLSGSPVTAAHRGRRIALVPQDSLSALSPVHPVGEQLAAAVRSVRKVSRREARARSLAALDRVGVPAARARAHAHEFSGGMRQRAVIAMALVNEPAVVVADEPTTALDPDVQDQVLAVLAAQREATGAALVLVTHDLAVVRQHADRIAVMYAGRIVEHGPARPVLDRPRAPYTAGLLASLPDPAAARKTRLPALPGHPPAVTDIPPGCAFAPRCPHTTDRCHVEVPALRALDDGRTLACHLEHPA
ncbi:ABC transporter ATP-binding protein [Streptomyces boluensis]|uniref:ATP-binding cassette domain-containing protein n=1 Tax=Streptomyces boluensis TaxID=1775135 RepID=A0A964XLG0_9ACTN|nr:ABC transporter ATP-binding protein [Streptomyces boluensis]NBE53275.1 ATP-binding cassette domain-containing protein [Streptomyces boluensis]